MIIVHRIIKYTQAIRAEKRYLVSTTYFIYYAKPTTGFYCVSDAFLCKIRVQESIWYVWFLHVAITTTAFFVFFYDYFYSSSCTGLSETCENHVLNRVTGAQNRTGHQPREKPKIKLLSFPDPSDLTIHIPTSVSVGYDVDFGFLHDLCAFQCLVASQ